jgi:hypothetical protein
MKSTVLWVGTPCSLERGWHITSILRIGGWVKHEASLLLLVTCLDYSLILRMKAVYSSVTSTPIRTTRCYNPQDRNLKLLFCHLLCRLRIAIEEWAGIISLITWASLCEQRVTSHVCNPRAQGWEATDQTSSLTGKISWAEGYIKIKSVFCVLHRRCLPQPRWRRLGERGSVERNKNKNENKNKNWFGLR